MGFDGPTAQTQTGVVHYAGCVKLCQKSATCESFYYSVSERICKFTTMTIGQVTALSGEGVVSVFLDEDPVRNGLFRSDSF